MNSDFDPNRFFIPSDSIKSTFYVSTVTGGQGRRDGRGAWTVTHSCNIIMNFTSFGKIGNFLENRIIR